MDNADNTALLDNGTCATIGFDRQWRCSYLNCTAEKLLSMRREELVGRSAMEIFPGFELTRSYRLGVQAIQEQITLAYEQYLPSFHIWAWIRLYPLQNDLLFFIQDVTQYKQALGQTKPELAVEPMLNAYNAIEVAMQIKLEVDKQAQKDQERLQLVQQAANIGIFEWNIQTGNITWTEEAERLFGLQPGEFGGSLADWERTLHPDDVQISGEMLYASVEQKKDLDIQFRVIWPDQSIHWIYAKAHTFYDHHERPLRMVGINIDITDRKRYEEDLKIMEGKLRLFAESDVIGFIFADIYGTISYANDVFLRLIGYSRSELEEGKILWTNITPPEWLLVDQQKINETRQTGMPCLYEKEYLHKNGSKIDVLIGFLLLGDKKDQAVAFALDITERKRLERQKDEFIGIASHELKTPITSLKAFAQVLQNRFKKAGDQQNAEMLAKMDAQINKLTELVEDLLDATKVEAGKLQLNETAFTLMPLIDEIVEEMQRTTAQHAIIKEGYVQQAIWGDRDRIGQVMTNLLSNAIKYSPKADTILVKVSSDDGQATISVQDFGMGIPQEKQEQIFQRFYRVDDENHQTISGLGLGLYISAEMVKRHAGTMWFESKEGYGSTFSFRIPLQKKDDNGSNVAQIEEAKHE